MRKLLLVMILASTSSSIAWCQNGTKLIGYDAVTSGRGGTATGIFDNPSLMMNNPAGLAFLPSSQGDLSFSLMEPKVYRFGKSHLSYFTFLAGKIARE